MPYLIKSKVPDPDASVFEFLSEKTMYGGKKIERKDQIFVFDSENNGGRGLIAWGIVEWAEAVPKRNHGRPETPRVSIRVKVQKRALRPLGRSELRPFSDWDDGRPESELNFKFYRQATNKIGGISNSAAEFLLSFFSGR